LYAAVILYSTVIGFILYFSFTKGNVLTTLLIIIPFAYMIGRPLLNAVREPVGRNIGRAVKAGVLGLILMNAAWAAAFGALYLALLIIFLLPLSLWLGKQFAVT
jgi:4-hydroxybenzoate polyprenyltransferase